MAEQFFSSLADEGVAAPSIEKLKTILPEAEKGASFLSQTYGLSFNDSTRLSLAIHLLSNLPIPSKLLNIRPLKSQLRSNLNPINVNPYDSFNQSYNLNPYAQYTMYQQYQSPVQYLGTGSVSSTGTGGSVIPPTGYITTPVPSVPGYSQTTLFVRNLPNTTSEEEVLAIFQNYGAIREARFQKNKETQQFSGSVFLEYVHSSAARLAQIQLNEKTWGDRVIHIDFAKERMPKEVKDNDPIHLKQPSNSLYVSNLPPECDKSMLIQLFARFGSILDARTLKKEDGTPKGIAFIDFALIESAAAAIDALDNTLYGNKTLKVSYATNPSKRKGDDLGQHDDSDLKRFRADGGYSGVPMYYDPSQMGYGVTSGAGIDQTQWGYGQGYY